MDRYDVIVIGAGIAGLVTARDTARRGAKVKLIEASGRIGGQIWSIKHDGSAQTIALGAEWLHSEKHESLFKEMSEYGLSLDRFKHKREYCLYSGKGDKAKVDELPLLVNQIKIDPLFVSALATINWDVSFITFCKGYDQLESEQFDMPFHEYVTTRLKIPETSFVYEYILMQTFYFTGGNPLTQSALGVLYVIAGFRTAEKAYGMEGPLLRRYPESLGRLIEKLAEDIKELGVSIDVNMPVVSVRKEETFLPPNRVANYDYPALPDRERIVHVKCTKASFCTRSVIVCVPMKCITSILFYPSLPLAVTKAAERCNAGADQIKMYAFAAGISSDIARLITAQYECRETYTIARHHKHNPNALSAFNNSAANAAAVLAASSASAKSNQGRGARRTLTASYSRSTTGTGDEHMHNHTLICTNGAREDLLKNIARNLRKIHPVIELPNDSNSVTPGPSRPSTAASPSLDARRPSTPLIDHREGAMRSNLAPHEQHQITAINTSAYTVSHDNSIIYHDFLSDVCCRGTWFNLRSGTAYLHVLAIKAAQMPWDKSNNIHIEGTTDTSQQSPSTAAPPHHTNQQCTDDLSLIIAGGELFPEWTGWVEGAVRSGAAAAKRVIPYLFPPMVERNFMKRAIPSAKGELMSLQQPSIKSSTAGGIVLPALSRSLLERRSNIS